MLQETKELGTHLALALQASTLSDEQKRAWAALVPDMSLEQMLRLVQVLQKYVDQNRLAEITALREDLLKIKEEHDKHVGLVQGVTERALDQVMAQVKAAETQA